MISLRKRLSGVHHHRLDNGMQVYSRGLHNIMDIGFNGNLVSSFYQRAVSPKLDFVLSISSGSALDPSDKRGLHHLFEHCFLATKDKPSISDLGEFFEQRKGWINAFTSPEKVAVVGQVEDTPDNFQDVMDYLSGIINDPYFDSIVLDREKNRVLVEFMEYEDDINKRLNDVSYTNMASYKGVPVKTLGDETYVSKATTDDLKLLHKEICVGENLSLTLVTRMSPLLIDQMTEKSFSAVPRGNKSVMVEPVYKYGQVNHVSDGQEKSSNFNITSMQAT